MFLKKFTNIIRINKFSSFLSNYSWLMSTYLTEMDWHVASLSTYESRKKIKVVNLMWRHTYLDDSYSFLILSHVLVVNISWCRHKIVDTLAIVRDDVICELESRLERF